METPGTGPAPAWGGRLGRRHSRPDAPLGQGLEGVRAGKQKAPAARGSRGFVMLPRWAGGSYLPILQVKPPAKVVFVVLSSNVSWLILDRSTRNAARLFLPKKKRLPAPI